MTLECSLKKSIVTVKLGGGGTVVWGCFPGFGDKLLISSEGQCYGIQRYFGPCTRSKVNKSIA